MKNPNSTRRWATLGLGVLALAGGTFALASRSLAQAEGQPRPEGRRDGEVRRTGPRDGEVRREGPRDPGGLRPEGQPGFQPGFPGGFPGGPGMGPMGPMMGAPTMTATATTVYVLRGNTLFAFDANTLRLKARTELPAPEFRPGGPGGPGGGFGGGPGGNREF